MEIEKVDLEMLGTALADQGAESRWTFDPLSGESSCWFAEGDDEPDEEALFIEPLPSRVWYRDMADFVARLSDKQLAARLERTMSGRGAFRRFRDEIYHDRDNGQLITAWNAFRDNRAERRAVDWLLDNQQITEEAADRYRTTHPDPEVP
ncbi:UPF0158 family protein [Actinoplanes subtropicus]|uniref:UPF0158 family protein n=1 Tax=Actinoplanes subtropicus TaxID=543632 RepID=UPI0004C2B2FC|nr:UPF0158 family protein [Actinoplanes subtropicus]